MTAGLKEAYQRANVALMTALYNSPNDTVAHSVLSGLVQNPAHLVESIVRISALLFQQINAKLKFVKSTPQIVLPFAKDIVAHVIDLGTQTQKIQPTPQQEQAALSATIETVMRMCGVTKQQVAALKAHVGQSAVDKGLADYHAHLQATKGATPPQGAPGQTPGGPAPPAGGQPANGAPPQAAGPGAQQPQGQPQPGAPVTAAPGPGQSAPPGGMLSQAAANPPQGA